MRRILTSVLALLMLLSAFAAAPARAEDAERPFLKHLLQAG